MWSPLFKGQGEMLLKVLKYEVFSFLLLAFCGLVMVFLNCYLMSS